MAWKLPKFTNVEIVNATVFETQMKLKQLNLELNNRKLSNLFTHQILSMESMRIFFSFLKFYRYMQLYILSGFDNEMCGYDNPVLWRRPARYMHIFFYREIVKLM